MSLSKEYLDFYSSTESKDLLISYKGPFLEDILGKLSEIVRESFTTDPVLSRKLIAIFLEMAQNVYFYSSESVDVGDKIYGIGSVMVVQKGDKFTFKTGNYVSLDYVETLIECCELVNSLDREGLRQLKREVRTDLPGTRSKGAGIGLIQIALTASQKIHYEYSKVDDKNVFFSLSINITK
jgi:hypothetical protein